MSKKYYFISIVLLFLLGNNSIAAVNTLWDNSSSDQNWHNPLNWQFDALPSASGDNSVLFIWPDFALPGLHPIISQPGAVCDIIFINGTGFPGHNSSNVELNGGTFTTRDAYLSPSAGDFGNPGGYTSALYIKSGTMNITGWLITNTDSNDTVEMTGGTFNIYDLQYKYLKTAGMSRINLHGGTINILNSMYLEPGLCNVDITNGTLTLPGDWRLVVDSWESDGRMTAYGGQGSLSVDYDITSAGKTTVTALPCPDTTPTWQRDEVNLLTGFLNMYNPHIIEEPNAAYPYRMWFFGWATAQCNPGYPGCDAIFTARSTNLTNWQVYKGAGSWDATGDPNLWVPVLTADNKYYDQNHNGDPSVVKYNGTYYMAYSATGFDLDGIPAGGIGDTDGDISCVMGATSTDGLNWTRSSAPLLIYTPEIGQPDIYDGSTVAGMFHRPSLMLDDGQWKIWFDYWAGASGLSMGLAECSIAGNPMDANNWTVANDLNSPVITNWPNPDVVKVASTYYAYGDPPGSPEWSTGDSPWISRQLAEAVSYDGINWDILGFITSDSDTPANQVPEAVLLNIAGKDWLYLFYSCQVGGTPYDSNYDRIRAMRMSKTPQADQNGDNNVDLLDFAIFAGKWLDTGCTACDLDFTGKVDFKDLNIFVDSWLFGK